MVSLSNYHPRPHPILSVYVSIYVSLAPVPSEHDYIAIDARLPSSPREYGMIASPLATTLSLAGIHIGAP